MNSLKNLTNYVASSILGLSLLGALTGCESRVEQSTQRYQFERFDDVFSSGNTIHSLASADLDGDGDMDIVIGTPSRVYLYENKMPQKSKLENTR
jgi:hypothetical protein